ncbi:putative sister chromatid cohesion and DNA repair protein [Microthyrium microscopicum]|uniref:Putative sister chromatid cohesion and DNA repair protein n=1 Tax=Microthyrium microscopicum TaxID=703497 RepID=A0A6A6UUM1_9PEZI|nr:putative sister chromatid cohesion and DNA repair protein [Microthyrium microscopicum]
MAPTRRSRRIEAEEVPLPSSDAPEPDETEQIALKFNQPISWPAGRPIAEGELIKRLHAFYDELKEMDDGVDLETIRPKAKDLVAERLLKHKNKGVQAYTACCLVEILRIFAPDAPYTGKELKTLFAMIIEHIVPALANSSVPYHEQNLHVIRSLADIQSVLLLEDLPSASHLFRALFTAAFDVLSGPSKSGHEVTKSVAHALTEMLSVVIADTSNLPDEVIDIVLAQFLRADPRALSSGKPKKEQGQFDDKQATLNFRDAPAAYTMAQDICISNDDKMARYVLRYFSSVLLDTTIMTETSLRKPQRRKPDDLDDDDGAQGPTEEELKESKKAHMLLRELWRAAPTVLQEIIPQLEQELTTDNTPIRLMAVEAVGDMIAGIGAAGPPAAQPLDPVAYPSQSLDTDTSKSYHFLLTPSSSVAFPTKYHSTYEAFLARRNDKSSNIRAAWAKVVGRIISTSAGGVGLDSDEEDEMLKHFAVSLQDGEERVRHAAIEAIQEFSFQAIVLKLGKLGGAATPGTIMATLADRATDKKLQIRIDAIRLLANIWGVGAGAIAQGDEKVTEVLGAIPSRLFNACYTNDPEIHKAIDRALFDSLIPLSFPPTKPAVVNEVSQSKNGDTAFDGDLIRVERMLLLVKSLDEKAKLAFLSKQKQQPSQAKAMLIFINHCEAYNGGVIEAPEGKTEKDVENQLKRLIQMFAERLPESEKAASDLNKFAKQHNRRYYKLIGNCCSLESDWAKIRKSIKELSNKISESVSSTSLHSSMLDTLLTMLYRCSVLIYNPSNVPAIIHFSRTDEKGLGATAHEMLKELSKTQPEVFSNHVQELCKTLTSDAPTASKTHRANAIDDLKACAEFARKFSEKVPQDRKFFNALMSYVKFGLPLAAKYATRILLTTAQKKNMFATEIFKACAEGFEYGKPGFLSRLAALSQLVLHGTQFLDGEDINAINNIAINQVLTNPAATSKFDSEKDELWTNEPDDNIQAKGWALKMVVNHLRALPDDDAVKDSAGNIYKFLDLVISKEGQVSSKNPAPKSHASRLRLLAAQSLVKLAREQRFSDLVTPMLFNKLALTAQDPVHKVREGFVKKLIKYLGQSRLSQRFYTPLFLLAFEPEAVLKGSTEAWLRAQLRAYKRENTIVLQLIIPRLISLLAHHPDFDDQPETLSEMARYFIFYLKVISNQDNISLIFHLTQRVKNVGDGITPGSPNIYILSDLAQAVIQRWVERQNWSMTTWPDKINLPGGIFAMLENTKVSYDIANKMYVPAEVIEGLDELVAEGLRTKKSKRARLENGTSKSKKRNRDSTEAKKDGPVKKKKVAKTPKRKFKLDDSIMSSERRRSGRQTGSKSYVEVSDEDAEEAEAEDGAEEDSHMNGTEKDVLSIGSDSDEMDED